MAKCSLRKEVGDYKCNSVIAKLVYFSAIKDKMNDLEKAMGFMLSTERAPVAFTRRNVS